jgi:hypothetical protein
MRRNIFSACGSIPAGCAWPGWGHPAETSIAKATAETNRLAK